MHKALVFWLLLLYSWIRTRLNPPNNPPKGIHGSVISPFIDPGSWRLHGVVAFLLPPNTPVENFRKDLWGPFGWEQKTQMWGYKLYGRDTWGAADAQQIGFNNALYLLHTQNPNCTIILAGVRGISQLPWKANTFILAYK